MEMREPVKHNGLSYNDFYKYYLDYWGLLLKYNVDNTNTCWGKSKIDWKRSILSY